jgi:cold shock CspA family protein
VTPGAARRGVVAAFDEAVGLGQVVEAGSGAAYRFHCTQIADGTRRIDVGTAVRFTVQPGRDGTWEAVGVDRTA